MKRSLRSRVLSVLMALVMVFSVFPVSAFAAESDSATYKQVTDVSEITAGGQFVLVAENDGNYKAVAATTSGKPSAIAVTVADGTVSGTDLPVWTIAASDSGVSLNNGTNFLGYGTSGTNFTSSSTAYTWSVAEKENDTFCFTSAAVTSRGIFYQVSGDRFGAYSTSNTSGYITDLLVFKYAEVSGSGGSGGTTPDPDPGETPDPDTPTGTEYVKADTIADGDTVVIYNAGSGTIMSSAMSGYNLAGVAVTPADDKIVTDDATVAWTVSIADGKVTFKQGDKVLGATQRTSSNGKTYVNPSLNAADGYNTWVLEKGSAAATWYVKNDTCPARSYGR